MDAIASDVLTEMFEEIFNTTVMSNLMRPLYVERLLAKCLGDEWKCVSADWAGWDIEHQPTSLRVEVKQSAARQSWTAASEKPNVPTRPVFDIAERTGFFRGSRWIEMPGRMADIYIFAWHPGFEPIEAVDHRDPSQWEFHVLPEGALPKQQRSIALSVLQGLNPKCCGYADIRAAVEFVRAQLGPLKATLEPS